MKIYLRDFNNVAGGLATKFDMAEDPRDADVLVTWQDVRGDMKELCELNAKYMHKPVVTVQHGRGATRDYHPPNKFPMKADKFCCWGPKDYERLASAGYADRAVITGSPLINRLVKREEHDGKNIVFVPVITQHEEPENIYTYWELKKIELSRAQMVIHKSAEALKDNWNSWHVDPDCVTDGSLPYHVVNKNWRLIAKLAGGHDRRLYMGDVVQSAQVNRGHIDDCMRLLSMTDCVVGMEEGTFQLLAMAMDIPVVMVNGFRYKVYGGVEYSSVETIKTDAAHWVDLADVESAIDLALTSPKIRREERKRVVEEELGVVGSDPLEAIAQTIREASKWEKSLSPTK